MQVYPQARASIINGFILTELRLDRNPAGHHLTGHDMRRRGQCRNLLFMLFETLFTKTHLNRPLGDRYFHWEACGQDERLAHFQRNSGIAYA